MVCFTPWCCFEPETGVIDYALHMFKGNFIPGETWLQHNTVNAKESIQDPIRLACDHGAIAEQSWKLYSKTTWKISMTFGGSGLFSRWKQNSSVGNKSAWVATSNHGLDLEVISRHLLTMSSHWKTRELNITIHHKQKGAVWCHTANGCTAEIPATCEAQSWSQTEIERNPMQSQMFIILGSGFSIEFIKHN